ncbi:hypothetical protein [Halomonas sp. MMSF_3323]|uniref:hypothetical protein n=1 Tax=Halomonas sp. MMSF_3323 TaxID=3046701 RepID=UPI00273D575F|nr:hypothetical protein [Halomonas sp. MMSF_3323]
MSTANQYSPALIAYHVTEASNKAYWSRIGAAWPNKKGGFQVKLETLPVNGELVLLPPKTQGENEEPA